MKAVCIIITVVFGWSVMKDVEVMLRSTSMDAQLFAAAGVPWLLYALLIPAVCCYAGGIAWVWRPYRGGLLVGLAALALSTIETGIGTVISLGNIDLVKEAMIVSREARGLSVRQEALDMMDNPLIFWLPFGVSVVFAAVLAFLLVKIHKYHHETAMLWSQEER